MNWRGNSQYFITKRINVVCIGSDVLKNVLEMIVMYTSKSSRVYKTGALCLGAILMCVCFASATSSANAQEASLIAAAGIEYQTANPEVIYLDNTDGYDARSLTTTLYVSDDEIWYSGLTDSPRSYLIQANSKGEILAKKTFPDAPSKYPIIQCISKVGQSLMLGFIDAENQAGAIGLIGSNGDTSYISIRDDVQLMSMAPTAKGIFALGVNFNEKADLTSLYALHYTASGNIDFEKVIYTAKMAEDMYSLSASIGCELNDRYFCRVTAGIAGRLQPERVLICLNSAGSEQWKVLLPENLAVQRISASDKNIYLYGMWGDIDENDTLTNQKATVMCFSVEGVEKWKKIFEQPTHFYFGASISGICVAAGGLEGPGTWNLCSINTDGSVRNLTSVDFSDDIHVRGVFASPSGYAKILGTTETQLFLYELPY